MRVLIIEDEPGIAATVAQALREYGIASDVASDGAQGLTLARQTQYETVILDLLLPRVPGLRVLRMLRDEQPTLPILVMTALDDVDDRIAGLDLGADDYVTKPFALGELLARTRALIRRRSNRGSKPVITTGDLVVDTGSRVVRRGGRTIVLTPRLYALLLHFVSNHDVVLTRQEIGVAVIDRVFEPRSNLLEVSIHELRSRLGDPPLIHTVRGVGYRFCAE